MRKAVGFYWTLPVPWASFKTISSDVDEAAKQSETIRFQVELVRRYAHDHALNIIREDIFIEIDPDRGSEMILEPLGKLEALCQDQDAVLLLVDFTVVHRWRDHGYLNDWSERTRISVERVPAEKIFTAGKTFDPHAHFADWRRSQDQWIKDKPLRREKARARAVGLKSDGCSAKKIALALNAEGFSTATGKAWAESNVRALLK